MTDSTVNSEKPHEHHYCNTVHAAQKTMVTYDDLMTGQSWQTDVNYTLREKTNKWKVNKLWFEIWHSAARISVWYLYSSHYSVWTINTPCANTYKAFLAKRYCLIESISMAYKMHRIRKTMQKVQGDWCLWISIGLKCHTVQIKLYYSTFNV